MNNDRRRLLSQATGNGKVLGRTAAPGWIELNTLLEEVRSWGHREGKVRGVLVYGSVARGEADPYSDLDILIVVQSEDHVAEVEKALLSSWEVLFDFVKDGKHIAFLEKPFIKMELSIVPEDQLSQLRTMFAESPPTEAERVVIVDKSGKLRNVLLKWLSENTRLKEEPFQREANSFLYYYNGFHLPFARGDTYRAFFQYCLMFFKIATLAYIAQGGKDYLYSPQSLMYKLDKETATRLRELSPVFDPLKMRKGAEEMFEFFLDMVERSKMTQQFPPTTMRGLRESILANHPRFLGLRDLGMIEGVRPGTVFRASRLDRYPPEELIDWIKVTDLRTIIDLRTPEEIKQPGCGYPKQVLERVSYLHLPVTTKLSDEHVATGDRRLTPRELFYAKLPFEKSFQEALRQVVMIITDRSRCPVVIHCRGGRDRTGMMVAVILQAVGIPSNWILADYLLSYGDASPVCLQRMFESLSKEGTEAYLRNIGFSRQDLFSLKSNIVIPTPTA